MRKFVSIIATAAITGSIAMAGAMSSFAAEDNVPEVTTLATTEVTTVTSAETTTVTSAGTTATESAPAQSFTETDAAEKAFDALTKEGESRENYFVTNSVYDADNDFWTVTLRRNNGNDIRTYKATADGAVRIGDDTAVTTASATATTTNAETTTAAAATTSKTTANKNGSPKTGVAFPAIPVAGIAVAAAVAFTLKKKEK